MFYTLYAVRYPLYEMIHAKKHYFVKKNQVFKYFGVLMSKKHIFRRLLKKAISMALWPKASLCVKSSLLEQSMPRTQSRLKQNQCYLRNLRNPWLINDLRLCKALYNCRETITDVMSPLQIKPFYAKQSQFPKKSNERK